MGEVGKAPEHFTSMETLASLSGPLDQQPDFPRSFAIAFGGHVVVLLLMLVGPVSDWLWEDPIVPSDVVVRFYEKDGEGRGGGGGGGGSGGETPTAYIPLRFAKARPEPEVPPEPRRAPIAPRKPRRLVFDDLDVPDLPSETDLLFAGVFSPDATDMPGLSLTDGRDFGGLDTKPSSGTGGGIGGARARASAPARDGVSGRAAAVASAEETTRRVRGTSTPYSCSSPRVLPIRCRRARRW